ncbi:MAG: hypothetical protein H9893_01325 [Candidatus Niameybacter stercoravium]|nr:hypothetical protein [Candidatus Niameybacter stercoravium]
MKKIGLMIISMLLLTQTLQACWIYSIPQERVNRAGMIAIVELVGQSGTVDRGEYPVGRDQTKISRRKDTVWEVKVHQVIKGFYIGESSHILTDGARDNKVQMSTDFYLDEQMDQYALVYLNRHEQGYYIEEPADVVPLKQIIEGDLEATLQEKNLSSISKQDQKDWIIYQQLLLGLEEERQGLFSTKIREGIDKLYDFLEQIG